MAEQANILLAGNYLSIDGPEWNTYQLGYHVKHVSEVDEVLRTAVQDAPDLIFVGYKNSQENDLDLCEQLTQNPETACIPVLVITPSGDLDVKILAYRAGAFDCIESVPQIIDISAKLKLVARFRNSESDLSEQAKLASDTALSVMAGNSELGQAIRFVERSYNTSTYSKLAEALLTATSQLSLECCIFFDSRTEAMYFSHGGVMSPLEEKLLYTVHQDQSRTHDLGARSLISFPNITLLIKNMPIDEPERYGRIKDLIPSILGAADARIRSLDTEQVLIKQSQNVSASFVHVRKTLDDLEASTSNRQDQTINLMREMLEDLENKIPSMGLEDDQERYLLNRVDLTVEQAREAIDQREILSSAFRNISDLLTNLSNSQQDILELVQEKQDEIDDSEMEDDSELF